MNAIEERRKERRLSYDWSVWLVEDFDRALSQGQMIDVSSRGACFSCCADEHCPSAGQQVTARFSVPRFGAEDSYYMANFTRVGRICRVEDINRYLRRVAIEFCEPLTFRPGEQDVGGCEEKELPKMQAG